MQSEPLRALSDADIHAFVLNGFVRLDDAFSKRLAEQARSVLWEAAGCDPHDRSTWNSPVIRLGQFAQSPFREAANTPLLHSAFDQLVGCGRWMPQGAIGTFVIRFPSRDDPGDDGWHIDVSFGDSPDFMEWRANVNSKGRALLMFFMFTDTGPDDASTRIRAGSHKGIAHRLAEAGEKGLTLRELAADGFSDSAHRPEVLAVGEAGTVYLCHPFLVHAAQRHRGAAPRILAQPPLLPREAFGLARPDGRYSPVEMAIRYALAEPGS